MCVLFFFFFWVFFKNFFFFFFFFFFFWGVKSVVIEGVQVVELSDGRSNIHVLKLIEERTLLALSVDLDLRVLAPGGDDGFGDAAADEGAAEVVVLALDAEPVEALGHTLEGGGGGVDAVVADVGLGLEAEVLPVAEDLSAEGVLGGLL